MNVKDILELDSKRTQGDWAIGHINENIDTMDVISVLQGEIIAEDVASHNAGLIATVPLMVEIIKEQQEALKEAFIAMDGCTTIASYAKGASHEYQEGFLDGALDAKDHVRNRLMTIIEKIEPLIGEQE